MELNMQHPRNSESKISERVAIYNGYVDELADCFPWAQHLNADQDPLTVFECIESMIVNPLPKRPQIAPTVSQTWVQSINQDLDEHVIKIRLTSHQLNIVYCKN